jgi:hypothetical protein
MQNKRKHQNLATLSLFSACVMALVLHSEIRAVEDSNLTSISTASVSKIINATSDCKPDCDDFDLKKLPYIGIIHDKESAFDTWTNAEKRLALPKDPDWDEFPPALVLDPNSKIGMLEDAINTKIYDPLHIADLQQEGDADLEFRSISKGLRDATGCEVHDKACLDQFMLEHSQKRKAWG